MKLATIVEVDLVSYPARAEGLGKYGCMYAKESSLSYYLPIAREITDGFIPFLRTLAQSETQAPSSWIWTLVADSISYDDNRYDKPPLSWLDVEQPNLVSIRIEPRGQSFPRETFLSLSRGKVNLFESSL